MVLTLARISEEFVSCQEATRFKNIKTVNFPFKTLINLTHLDVGAKLFWLSLHLSIASTHPTQHNAKGNPNPKLFFWGAKSQLKYSSHTLMLCTLDLRCHLALREVCSNVFLWQSASFELQMNLNRSDDARLSVTKAYSGHSREVSVFSLRCKKRKWRFQVWCVNRDDF